jgi:GMP synthase (glutamine-hydrolysing)
MAPGFESIAHTDTCPHAAIAGPEGEHMYGLQFHPEVTHSVKGMDLLRNFVVTICKAPTDWNMLGK